MPLARLESHVQDYILLRGVLLKTKYNKSPPVNSQCINQVNVLVIHQCCFIPHKYTVIPQMQ